MSVLTEAPPAPRGDMVVQLRLKGSLDDFLAVVELRPGQRIKYCDGRLTIVSPSHRHENASERLDGVVKGIGAELDIGYRAMATTLYRVPGREKGIMADRTYYVANAAAVPSLKPGDGIDLAVLPPPDLAIEVVVWHDLEDALAIYGDMGVPEVWVDRARMGDLEFLHRDEAGRYVERETSRSFPFLAPADVLPWVESDVEELDQEWERRMRAWVRATLAPRRA